MLSSHTNAVRMLWVCCLVGCSDPASKAAVESDAGADGGVTDTLTIGGDVGTDTKLPTDTAGTDTGTAEWTETGDGPATGVFQVTSLGDRLLAVGNQAAVPTAETYEYAATTKTWAKKTLSLNPPNLKAYSASFSGAAGKALLLGGRTTTSASPCAQDAWTYDSAGWKKIPLPDAQGFVGEGSPLWSTILPSGDVLAIGGNNCTTLGSRTDAWRWNGSAWSAASVTGCPVTSSGYKGGPIAADPSDGSSVLLVGAGDTWRWNGSACSMAKAGGPITGSSSFLKDDWMASDGDRLYLTNQKKIFSWSATTGWAQVGTMQCTPFGGGRIAPGRFAFLCPGSGSATRTWEWAPK